MTPRPRSHRLQIRGTPTPPVYVREEGTPPPVYALRLSLLGAFQSGAGSGVLGVHIQPRREGANPRVNGTMDKPQYASPPPVYVLRLRLRLLEVFQGRALTDVTGVLGVHGGGPAASSASKILGSSISEDPGKYCCEHQHYGCSCLLASYSH